MTPPARIGRNQHEKRRRKVNRQGELRFINWGIGLLPLVPPVRTRVMKLPAIRGLIDRRILANYRVDPAVLASHIPAPFRPKIVNGWGIAGICLIRLAQIRPAGLPQWLGVTSENAAHRVAVEWE